MRNVCLVSRGDTEKSSGSFRSSQQVESTGLARHFLRLTRDHMAGCDGPRKDPDANNATILLKALKDCV
jgi:hypothetical protein